MSEPLSREQLEKVVDERFQNLFPSVNWKQRVLDTYAALRAELAAMTEERDGYKQKYEDVMGGWDAQAVVELEQETERLKVDVKQEGYLMGIERSAEIANRLGAYEARNAILFQKEPSHEKTD